MKCAWWCFWITCWVLHVTTKGNKELFSVFTVVWYFNSPKVRKCILLQQLCPSLCDPCFTQHWQTSPFFSNAPYLFHPPKTLEDLWIWVLTCVLGGGAVLLLLCLKHESRLYFMNQGWLFSVGFYGFHSWAVMSHNHCLIFSNQGVTHFAFGLSRLSVKGRQAFFGADTEACC